MLDNGSEWFGMIVQYDEWLSELLTNGLWWLIQVWYGQQRLRIVLAVHGSQLMMFYDVEFLDVSLYCWRLVGAAPRFAANPWANILATPPTSKYLMPRMKGRRSGTTEIRDHQGTVAKRWMIWGYLRGKSLSGVPDLCHSSVSLLWCWMLMAWCWWYMFTHGS